MMNSKDQDFSRASGSAAIGARLRRLSERIDSQAFKIYASSGEHFEQRWFGVLNLIVRFGPLSVSEIAERLGITHASVSETRASLEAAELVHATADPSDARRRLLRLTKKGEQLVAKMQPIWAALDEAAIELEAEACGALEAIERLEEAVSRDPLDARVRRLLKARD